jgi:hypothetical protein
MALRKYKWFRKVCQLSRPTKPRKSIDILATKWTRATLSKANRNSYKLLEVLSLHLFIIIFAKKEWMSWTWPCLSTTFYDLAWCYLRSNITLLIIRNLTMYALKRLRVRNEFLKPKQETLNFNTYRNNNISSTANRLHCLRLILFCQFKVWQRGLAEQLCRPRNQQLQLRRMTSNQWWHPLEALINKIHMWRMHT